MKRYGVIAIVLFAAFGGRCATPVRGAVDIVGSWTGELLFETNGFNYTPGAGSNRIVLVLISSESTTTPVTNIGSVTLGGQTVTPIESADGIVVGAAGAFHNVLWLGYLTESGIASMSGNAVLITWDQAPNNPDGGETLVQAATYENVHQTTPIVDSASNTDTSNTTIQAGNVSVGVEDRLIFVTACGDNLNHSAPSGYTEQLEQDDLSYALASVHRNATSASTENPTATWSSSFRVSIISAVLNFSGCDYVETFQSWSATSADTWETQDLSGSPYFVPANAVVEVAIRNGSTSAELWGGVRAEGSSLDRRIQLHEAEGGGNDFVTMHVQTDGSSQIRHYSDVTADVDFVLLGYWECGTYVEAFDTFTAGADGSWQDEDLCTYGVGPDHVVEILMTNDNGSNARETGVRTNGSGLERRVDLHEAEDGGVDAATMFVQADSTGSSTIEVYAETDADIDFYLIGYWSTAPQAYTELFVDPGSPSTDATWEDLDLTASGVPNFAIAEFVLANEDGNPGSPGNPHVMGIRENGSSLSRNLDVHEAEVFGVGVGQDTYRAHVFTDGTATIEQYMDVVADPHTFHLVGYWDSCDSSIEYSILDLGAVTAANDSLGQHINASGDVAGFEEDSNGDPDAWFSECGSFTSLGTLGGSDAETWGLNDAELAVGWSYDGSGDRRAFSWTSGGGLVNLGTIPGWTDSEAAAVNASGEVVGTVLDFVIPPERRMAFIYLPSPAYTLGAGMNELGTLGGQQSVAMDINDAGQVTGGAQAGTGQFLRDVRPFRWASGTMTNLGTLGSESDSILHRGEAINASGDVAGMSFTAGGDPHAFYWDGSMTDLGVLTGGDTSRALGINASSVVVGFSNVSGGAYHAFIWTSATGMRDLNDLIDAGSGWTLIRATDINDNGDITGWGTNGSGDYRAFRLTPTCSAGGGGAVASIAQSVVTTGAQVTDEEGVIDELVLGPQGQILGEFVVEALRHETFKYRVTETMAEVQVGPGPGRGTLAGFVDSIALPRTLTVKSGARPETFKITVYFSTTLDELGDFGLQAAEAGLYSFDTVQGTWKAAGVELGETPPTGVVGDCGYLVHEDRRVDYWVVRNKIGIFAVGRAFQADDPEPPRVVDSPGPMVCGLGMVMPMFVMALGLLVGRTGLGPTSRWRTKGDGSTRSSSRPAA